ncbi:MAG TPA: carboxymuconolactone decarboxylase family protein [Hyphomicrobiaceae bacterium]|nr:carboxymuconolactone decarboxylase family protein [Hyphomicrobiaceae bacterium]
MSGKPAEESRKVSRLPPLPQPLDPIIEELFADTRRRGGEPLNLHHTTGHAPKLSKARRMMTVALRNDCKTPRKLRELTILRMSHINDCPYERDHHEPLGLRAGLTQEQLDALPDWKTHRHLFSEEERALLAYVDALGIDRGEVDDATFADMEKHFSPQEIVEITYCATTYLANAIVVKAFRIERDLPHIRAAPGKF